MPGAHRNTYIQRPTFTDKMLHSDNLGLTKYGIVLNTHCPHNFTRNDTTTLGDLASFISNCSSCHSTTTLKELVLLKRISDIDVASAIIFIDIFLIGILFNVCLYDSSGQIKCPRNMVFIYNLNFSSVILLGTLPVLASTQLSGDHWGHEDDRHVICTVTYTMLELAKLALPAFLSACLVENMFFNQPEKPVVGFCTECELTHGQVPPDEPKYFIDHFLFECTVESIVERPKQYISALMWIGIWLCTLPAYNSIRTFKYYDKINGREIIKCACDYDFNSFLVSSTKFYPHGKGFQIQTKSKSNQ